MYSTATKSDGEWRKRLYHVVLFLSTKMLSHWTHFECFNTNFSLNYILAGKTQMNMVRHFTAINFFKHRNGLKKKFSILLRSKDQSNFEMLSQHF